MTARSIIQVTWEMSDSDTKLGEERALNAAMLELKLPGRIITLESYLREGL